MHASDAALQAQYVLARRAATFLATATDSCRAIQSVSTARGPDLPAALADTLAVLSDRGEAGLANVANALSGLLSSLEGSDAAPTQGMTEAIADCGARLDRLLSRWARVRAALPAASHP